jgi:hypothetical protein
MARCFECKKPATHNHHVIPQSLGGTKTVPLCQRCHPKAHGETGVWKIKELIKKAMRAKKAQGEYIGGQVGWGFSRDKEGKLVQDASEQAVAWWMLDQRLQGFTFVEIASMLEHREVHTKGGRQRWRPWRINQIVSRLLGEAAVVEGSY